VSKPDEPLTRETLRSLLEREGYQPDAYNLDNRKDLDDVFVLGWEGKKWVVWYAERGSRHSRRKHPTEDAACRDLLERLRAFRSPTELGPVP
jgi:hypothetical protein